MKSDFQSKGSVASFTVQLKGFEAHGSKNYTFDSFKANAILDSGSTICLLPDKQAQPIHDEFGVVTFTGIQSPFIDCAYRGDKGKDYSFDFKFSGKTISVPMEEMVVNALAQYQDQIMNDTTYSSHFEGWDGVCVFGIGNAAKVGINVDNFALLGDTFLRSAYVVYDLQNKQVSLAQSKLDTNDTDIVELKADDKAIPGAESAASKSSPPSSVPRGVIVGVI